MTWAERINRSWIADEFLKVESQFRLGDLPTEQFHPLTGGLSDLARTDPREALHILHRVDSAALATLEGKVEQLRGLSRRMGDTLRAGRRIHMVGCGSTGRLALACESLWRKASQGDSAVDQVTAFMAGGDGALVRAVEGFEDLPDFGERQLMEAGFRDGDLLIASTEGGETPFVIGAVELAADISSNPPCFLYCNPDGILARTAQRSARVLADSRIEKICLDVGPMALSGSTRMQASTVLMAAVGGALMSCRDPDGLEASLKALADFWKGVDTTFLSGFLEREAAFYEAGDLLDYVTDASLAVTLLTDTTERTPTFGFPAFGNAHDGSSLPSPCGLSISEASDSETAWESMLGRPPRGLEWPELGGRASRENLLGFDFSKRKLESRRRVMGQGRHHVFGIRRSPSALGFQLDELAYSMDTGALPMLSVHLVLKMLLNAHSTLVMGRLGRYEGNVMTWVKPTNYKLIDRTIRYADRILQRDGLNVPYESLARACFELREKTPANAPLVHALVKHFAAPGDAAWGRRTNMKGRLRYG